jgi:hypothetical protein
MKSGERGTLALIPAFSPRRRRDDFSVGCNVEAVRGNLNFGETRTGTSRRTRKKIEL